MTNRLINYKMKRLYTSFNFIKLSGLAGLLIFNLATSSAKENLGVTPVDKPVDHSKELYKKSVGCEPARAQRELNVNNVRTTILDGGDMWWDLISAKYEIPKVTQQGNVSKNSLFAGALWIGGVSNGNLRIAAQTYRQNGNDYFPGPLSIGTASITADRCKQFDKIWSVKLTDIDNFRSSPENRQSAGDDIKTWPWQGNVALGESQYLAPFFDVNKNGDYEWQDGDYPAFDQNKDKNIPDQMMFILYNDKGNIHTETYGIPIGLEFQTQAFAFSTNDEVNNMTFYRTKVINRGGEKIDSCVFGQWVDPDLGNYSDDYVECNVTHNLGICYNGEDVDPGTLGYGANPPSIGVNFFKGPKRADGSEIGLTKFVYYNNDWTTQGNPQKDIHYWGYLNGRWKDGSSIKYGGDGTKGSDTASFMFPGLTDPAGRTNWTEVTAGNKAGDRRFLQTAGSFSLLPGAVNEVTIGVVWARSSSGGARGSFNLLLAANSKAEALFNNNFNLIEGPKAPTMDIVELNKKLVLTITNTQVIENFSDSFFGSCKPNRTHYKFQGYQVFQLKSPSLPSDFNDVTQAQLVSEYDVVDDVNKQLVNTVFDPDLDHIQKVMVKCNNTGIQHSLVVTKDLFATGTDQSLSNFQNYYFMVVAFANATDCSNDALQYLGSRTTIGQDAIAIYSVSPHDPSPRGDGTQINSDYGDGIAVTQLEGAGNGGGLITLSQENINQALLSTNGYLCKERNYPSGAAPVYIKVINPLKVPLDNFELWLRDTSSVGDKADMLDPANTFWYIRRVSTGDVKKSQASILNPFEQIIPEWGISINITQCIRPGEGRVYTGGNSADVDLTNGFISSSIEYNNPTGTKWLNGVVDEDPNYMMFMPNQYNWIRSGTNGSKDNPAFSKCATTDYAVAGNALDPNKNFSKILGATWSPYALAAKYRSLGSGALGSYGPGSDNSGCTGSADNLLKDLYSVRIVFTSDKSKWSRCLVLETGEDPSLNMGGADKLDVRASKSVDKNGVPAKDGSGSSINPEDANYILENGMGWFPGYAINLETGERLNILFGENSSDPINQGQDMVWNPTSTPIAFKANQGVPVFGGKHYVYVMGKKKFTAITGLTYKSTRYDECRNYKCLLDKPADPSTACMDTNVLMTSSFNPSYKVRKRIFFSQAMYTTMPLASNLWTTKDGIVPNDVAVTINVKKPYQSFFTGTDINKSYNNGMPFFKFSTSGKEVQTGQTYAKKALDIVNIVPNPYYAFSIYEDPGNALDTRVKITNLPTKCTVRIYTLDGVLVRKLSRDDNTQTFLLWDLKNDAKVPISSGVYLIHIQATELGEERIIKWFGVMRTADYDSF